LLLVTLTLRPTSLPFPTLHKTDRCPLTTALLSLPLCPLLRFFLSVTGFSDGPRSANNSHNDSSCAVGDLEMSVCSEGKRRGRVVVRGFRVEGKGGERAVVRGKLPEPPWVARVSGQIGIIPKFSPAARYIDPKFSPAARYIGPKVSPAARYIDPKFSPAARYIGPNFSPAARCRYWVQVLGCTGYKPSQA